MVSGKNIGQGLGQARLKSREGKFFLDAAPPARAHFPGPGRIVEKSFKRLRKPLDIPVRHEQACYSVLHNVRNAPVRSANHGFSVGHGLQKHEAKTFSPAGQGEDIAICVAGEELLRREIEEKVCVFRDTQIASRLFQSWPVVSVADKHERCVRRSFQDTRQSGD